MATIEGARERSWSRAAAGAVVFAPREVRFRLVAAWTLWFLLFQAAFGLTWDIRWHAAVGRDSFWSPPHLLMYSGVALAGALCLAVVLVDTWRYWRGVPGVDDRTTWPVLGLFRAPLGFVVAGSGMVTLLIAAPFDNWWHELYGLDVTLWAPFHVMGLIGASIAGVGLIYAFAALAVRAARDLSPARRFLGLRGLDWALLLALSGLLSILLTAAQPATNLAPTFVLGPFTMLNLPPLLCAFLPPLFVAAVRVTGRPGAASLVLFLYTLRQCLVQAVVPWAIRLTAELGGYDYRAAPPRFEPFLALSPLFLLPAALAVDWVARWRRRGDAAAPAPTGDDALLAGALAGLALLAVTPALLGRSLRVAERGLLPPELVVPFVPSLPFAFLAAAPLALVVAVLAARLGDGWAAILRLNDR